MFTRLLVAALMSAGLSQAGHTEPNDKAASPQAVQSSDQTAANLPAQIRQQLTSSGYTAVRVVPSSFFVSAKDKSGRDVMMRVAPGSLSVITETPIGNQSASDNNGSSQASSDETNGVGAATSGAQSANDPRPVQDLQQAAQRLRDATHEMVRESASPQRNATIRDVDRTLAEVEGAIMSLPPNLLLAGTKQSEAQKSSEKLQQAADRLNQAVQALKSDTAGDQSSSIAEIKHALADIRRERMNIPNQTATR